MSRADKFALLLSLLAVLAAYAVADRVFERFGHLEDEIAFVWEAQVISRGDLTRPSPPQPWSFMVPFVIDHGGERFGKYPIGWPALLSYGVRFGLRDWINPLLAGLALWLTYRLGKRLLNEKVGLLAAGLTLTSPFFLLNSGSLLSHPFGLALSAALALVWLDGFGELHGERRWLATVTAGLLLGTLALTRPFTALAVAFPFALHGLYLLLRGDRATRLHLLSFGLIVASLAFFHFAWQSAVTGDALTNPYTLWWKYDNVGFGEAFGRSGHSLKRAMINLKVSLGSGISDLFGWPLISWLFLPFGFWAIRRDGKAWLVASVFFSLVLFHMAYWIGSKLFGPRYYYEGLYSLTLLTAAGIAWLAGWLQKSEEVRSASQGWDRARPLAVTALVTILVAGNLLFYLPRRLSGMFDLYNMQRSELAPFMSPEAQEFTPALVFVNADYWTDYGVFIELENAYLDTPFIFALSRSASANQEVAEYSSQRGRAIYYYYPDEPGIFYTAPRSIP